MKPTPETLEKTDRGFDAQTFWRHYVATVDTGQEWEEERPQQGSGSNRLFLFLLLFHIFLIGSVVLFNLVAERPKPVFADNSAPPKATTAPANKAPAPQKSATGTVVTAAKQPETVEHRVGQGDSLKSIADASGTTQEEIARLNHMELNRELSVGSVLQVPKPKSKAVPVAIPIGMQPSLSVAHPAIAPASAKMFAPNESSGDSKKTEAAPAPKKSEPIAIMPPEDKAKSKNEHTSAPAKPKVTAKVDETPPVAKPVAKPASAHIEESPPAAKSTVKVEDSPPAAKPKASDKVAETSTAKSKTTETKALVKTETPPASPAKSTEAVKPIEAAKSAKSATAKPALSGATYKVKANDTFYSIARKSGIKLDDLIKANSSVNPTKLREGMVLKLPAK